MTFQKIASLTLGVAITSSVAVLPARSTPETPKVTVGMTSASVFLGAFVARDRGFFAKHGLDVTILPMQGTASISSVIANSIQFSGPTPSNFLQAVDNGLDLVVSAGAYGFPTPSKVGVLVPPNSTVKGPKDLEGKKFGVPGLNALQHMLVRKWYRSQNADPAKTTFIELTFPQIPDALKSGQVEAASANEPFYERIIGLNVGRPIFDLSTLIPDGTIGAMYVSNREWTAKNPETIKAFRAGLTDAMEFIKKNPDEAKKSIGNYIKLPPEVIATLSIPNVVVEVKPASLGFWIDEMVAQRMINKKPPAEKLILP
jgi:NitT/TauT family transport system substrate-binding protein